ncbi:MAG: DNA polymerase III subunit delta [Bacteroidales bacterium]|nr:DNA polymerase III subunit delta [Bacteroidales bacterium]
MKLRDIPGHEKAKELLRRMVDDDRIPHALLLEGPEGIGKLALADALAQYIHCTNRRDGDSCGECPACRQHQTFNHVDTLYVYPVVKLEKMREAPVSDDFRKEWIDFRQGRPFTAFEDWVDTFDKKNASPMTYVTESASLLHKLSLTTQTSLYKVIVWWLPERMNEEAANKLLKLIEEPFHDTIFVMVSNNPSAILPTIYSRVQRVKMRRLSDDTIAEWLTTHHSIEATDALSIAHIADGNMVAALKEIQISSSSEEKHFFEMFKQFMRLAYSRKVKELRDWSADLAALGREKELKYYDFVQRQLRENFIYNFNEPSLNYLNREESQFSTRFARFITVKNIERFMTVMNEAQRDIAGNGNGKLINFDVAVKTMTLIHKP